MTQLLVAPTEALGVDLLDAVRGLMDEAFRGPAGEPDFDDDDWEHALGGEHVLALAAGGSPLAHAAVVERTLRAGARPLRTGYVEAVATRPDQQGTGLGSALMDLVGDLVRRRYEAGALGTGRTAFYNRLGWQVWQGRLQVLTADGPVRTPADEGAVMVLTTPATADLVLTGTLACEPRSGDVW